MSPVVRLNELERSLFNRTVASNPHLRPADMLLTTAYAQQAARVLRGRKDDAGLEKAMRALVLLGRSLRLTAQSVVEPKTAGRARRDAQPSPIDQYFAEHPDDDD